METDLITIEEACELLGVSRPTFQNIRERLDLHEYPIGKRVRFSRKEIQEKISRQRKSLERINALAVEEVDLDEVWTSGHVLNLDKISYIDAFCTSALLCSCIHRLRKGLDLDIVSQLTLNASYFLQQNFFNHLNRFGGGHLRIDPKILKAERIVQPEIILPITHIGFKGAEEKVTRDLGPILKKHGFSQDIESYISWALGELADNSHTHGEAKGLCFISVERMVGRHEFLQINILDLGIGIPTTLKRKQRYAELSNEQALLTAFKPNVSSWPDENDRGKGLTDIFKIAMQCRSFLRVESNDDAFLFNFQDAEKPLTAIRPCVRIPGTRFSITLIDNHFEEKVKRNDVANFIDKCLETI